MAERITTWEYVDNLCGVSGKSHNVKQCPSYANLMINIQHDPDYEGLSISGTHTSGQLVTQSELNYDAPQRYFIYCTFRPTSTVSGVNAIFVTNTAMTSPGTATGCPSYLNSDTGSFGTLTGGVYYTFRLGGTVASNGYETPPATIQISNASGTGTVSVTSSATVYLTIKYNNYSQYQQVTGKLTYNLRSA